MGKHQMCHGGNCEPIARRQFKSRRLLLFPCNLQMPYHKTEFRELSVFFELSSHLLCSPHKYVWAQWSFSAPEKVFALFQAHRCSLKVCKMQLYVFCLSGYQLLVLYNFLQLIFEGIRGPGIEGDIAIDDISIVEGECMKSDQPANSKWLFYTLGRANCFLCCRIEVSLKWMSCRRAKYCWVKSERLRVKSFLSALQRKEPLVQEGPKCLGWPSEGYNSGSFRWFQMDRETKQY